jgi:hypothetical protein
MKLLLRRTLVRSGILFDIWQKQYFYKMNIAEIGDTFSLTRKLDYLSDRTFLEYDLLIIDFEYLFYEKNDWNKSEFDKRQENLSEFIKYKSIPLVFITPKHRTIGFHSKWYNLDHFVPVPRFSVKMEQFLL